MLKLQLQHDSIWGLWKVIMLWLCYEGGDPMNGIGGPMEGPTDPSPSTDAATGRRSPTAHEMVLTKPDPAFQLPELWEITFWHSVVQPTVNSHSNRYWLWQAFHVCHDFSIFISPQLTQKRHPVSKRYLLSTLMRIQFSQGWLPLDIVDMWRFWRGSLASHLWSRYETGGLERGVHTLWSSREPAPLKCVCGRSWKHLSWPAALASELRQIDLFQFGPPRGSSLM